MSSKNKKENLFHFVTEEEMISFEADDQEETSEVSKQEENEANGLEEQIESSDNTSDEVIEEESTTSLDKDALEIDEKSQDVVEDIEEEESLEEDEEKLIHSTSTEDFIEAGATSSNQIVDHKNFISRLPYISFEARVVLMLFGIFALIVCSCFMILKAVRFGENEVVTYDEVSKTEYSVCLTDNDVYSQTCLDEGMQYVSSLVHNVSASFQYDVQFSEVIDYDLGYHIVGLTRIYDRHDNSKILYKTEDVLLERTTLLDESNTIHFDANASVDYQKYNQVVQDYKARYALDADASLDIVLYLDEPEESRAIASVTIPLGNQTFHIGKYSISNLNHDVEVSVNHWNEYTIFYTIVATVLLLLSMFLLYKLTRLVLKVTNNRNRYQVKLSEILREYDRIIVIARDGYESIIEKPIVKVSSFDELLDVKDALGKPIIYSKVNNVKSEFIVEDDEKLYKYVLKESDL